MAVDILAATIRTRCIATLLVNKMRIVREYFGLDRTTVTYDSEITGVGGNVEDFFVVAEVTKGDGSPATRTVITFSHEEVARMLADYRCNYPIESRASPLLIAGPRLSALHRIRRRLLSILRYVLRT